MNVDLRDLALFLTGDELLPVQQVCARRPPVGIPPDRIELSVIGAVDVDR